MPFIMQQPGRPPSMPFTVPQRQQRQQGIYANMLNPQSDMMAAIIPLLLAQQQAQLTREQMRDARLARKEDLGLMHEQFGLTRSMNRAQIEALKSEMTMGRRQSDVGLASALIPFIDATAAATTARGTSLAPDEVLEAKKRSELYTRTADVTATTAEQYNQSLIEGLAAASTGDIKSANTALKAASRRLSNLKRPLRSDNEYARVAAVRELRDFVDRARSEFSDALESQSPFRVGAKQYVGLDDPDTYAKFLAADLSGATLVRGVEGDPADVYEFRQNLDNIGRILDEVGVALSDAEQEGGELDVLGAISPDYLVAKRKSELARGLEGSAIGMSELAAAKQQAIRHLMGLMGGVPAPTAPATAAPMPSSRAQATTPFNYSFGLR